MEKTFTFASLPTSVEELKTIEGANLKDAFAVAALTAAVLCHYRTDPSATVEMLNALKGPQKMSNYDIQFLRDRLGDKEYLPFSFFAGAAPENGYTPSQPFTVTVKDSAYSYKEENYAVLYLTSSGADSDRSVKLRAKPSTGEWFLWENYLLSGIRTPKAEDPWA